MKNRGGASPAERPLRLLTETQLAQRFERALKSADGESGAHCIHERWMRGAMGIHIEAQLAQLWKHAADSIPDWLPTQFVEWLPVVYEVTQLFTPKRGGRSNIYLVLLDYHDNRPDNHGVYVGMTSHTPQLRFEQHKAGIRAAGSVLQRGLELLSGPTAHLQGIRRADAANIEEQLAEALRARGLFVQGGH
jgi:hypothetical protein